MYEDYENYEYDPMAWSDDHSECDCEELTLRPAFMILFSVIGEIVSLLRGHLANGITKVSSKAVWHLKTKGEVDSINRGWIDASQYWPTDLADDLDDDDEHGEKY